MDDLQVTDVEEPVICGFSPASSTASSAVPELPEVRGHLNRQISEESRHYDRQLSPENSVLLSPLTSEGAPDQQPAPQRHQDPRSSVDSLVSVFSTTVDDGSLGELPGLSADVWERSGGNWEVTHHFGAGLEMDCYSALSPGEDPKKFSPVHLPSTSLRALQQLRDCLQQPKAIALDIDFPKQLGSKSACNDMLHVLLGQFSDILTSSGYHEAASQLANRTAVCPRSLLEYIAPDAGAKRGLRVENTKVIDLEEQSVSSETLMRPELGMEAVDISICELPGLSAHRPLAVALMRLPHPLQLGEGQETPVRYAALVLCSADQAVDQRLACEVGRAIATVFMDEEFSAAVRATPRGKPYGVLKAFDTYLSTLTIVPTVHLDSSVGNSAEDLAEHLAGQLLSDSLVDSIEKLICRVRGLPRRPDEAHKLHHHILPNDTHPPERRRHYLVEVREKVTRGSEWHLTHRLRQGLELDLENNSVRPHLPRVSVAALAHLRRLMSPTSINLAADAMSCQDAIDASIKQLSTAGMPLAVADEMAKALSECIDENIGSPSQGRAGREGMANVDIGAKACSIILKPSRGDESCHILVATCRNLLPTQDVIGAFLRFSSLGGFCFAGTTSPVRFLTVIIGPMTKSKELRALADSLAGLSLDEDLMGDLDLAGTVNQFLEAVDERLENLVVVPHARVHTGARTTGGEPWSKTGSAKSMSTAASQTSPPEDERERKQNPSVIKTQTGTQMVHQSQSTHSIGKRQTYWWKWMISKAQKYSLPLVFGVCLALLWSNVDEESYHEVAEGALWEGASLLGHNLSLHFIVNDIFMCFFFGLAIKEVTEALLPGGSLSPLRRAVNPLMATLGGVVGPIVGYILCVLILDAMGSFDDTLCVVISDTGAQRRLGGGGAAVASSGVLEPCSTSALIKGWGVPTATDISLAWMFALLIFGAGHPAINFLLLLAIVDDALGMIIIAVFYPDPEHPVEPLWLLLVLAAVAIAIGLRKLQVQCWQVYIFLAGPVSWFGLIKAHVHPALALVFVVPLMPATHATRKRGRSDRHLGECDLGPHEERIKEVLGQMNLHPKLKRSHAAEAARLLMLYSGDQAPLHVFEHTMKLPVDFGMFLFGLANAGVKLTTFGGITVSILFALAVGKTLGIAAFALLASCFGFGLPNGVTITDLFAMSALGGVGLTVALFVANQAFVDPGLKGQAKMGAVLSVGCAGLGWAIRELGNRFFHRPEMEDIIALRESEGMDIEEATDQVEPLESRFAESDSEGSRNSNPASDWIDNLLVDEILQIMWTQRQYQARGTTLPPDQITPSGRRSSSKRSVRGDESITLGGDNRRSASKNSVSSWNNGLSSITSGNLRRARPSPLQEDFDSACPTPPNSISLAAMARGGSKTLDQEGNLRSSSSFRGLSGMLWSSETPGRSASKTLERVEATPKRASSKI